MEEEIWKPPQTPMLTHIPTFEMPAVIQQKSIKYTKNANEAYMVHQPDL